jgi:hypothetical protein
VNPIRLDEQCATDWRPVTERNRYFTGKPMTARDFIAEQHYFLSRHQLHNRLLHGWGVVCGLAVGHHPRPECRDRWVVVDPGIAIDCYGRELIVPQRAALALYDEAESERPDEELLICVRYSEETAECVPVLYGCNGNDSQPGRVRETAELTVVRLADVHADCWTSGVGAEATPCHEDHGGHGPVSTAGCLNPSCPCDGLVPLARIAVPDEAADQSATPFVIDVAGVRRIAPPRAYLSHVRAINWPHGGQLTVGDLVGMDRTLRVWFDRPLQSAQGNATGINAYTFVIQYGNVQRDLEFLDSQDPPTLAEDGCVAVFRIDDDYFRDDRTLAGNDLYVTLKCDFLVDCHGLAVDGDHVRGVLPSGNGVEGGLFESWFRVVGDTSGGEY